MKKLIPMILFLVMVVLVVFGVIYASKKGVSFLNNGSSLTSSEAVQYQCPMHPQVVQDHPGNCPICGMKLVKIETKAASVPGAAATLPLSDVAGHKAVHLTEEKIRSIGITTETVKDEPLVLPLRLTGTVFHNHEIFELLNAYRNAIQVEKRIKKPTPELVAESRAAAWSLRNKLRRYGLGEEVFKKAEESLEDPTSFVPAHLIIEANGAYVDARLPVFDLAHVKLSQKARIYSPMAPEQALEGVLRSLDSVVDFVSQTLAVRFEVVSGHELLKPGMFVTVEMELNLGKSLSISSTALFNPGKSAYVFVEKEPGVFVPQNIQAGVMAGERVQVLSGVQAGEKVVVAANFLLDSESRFQASRAGASNLGSHSHD